jgi:hypothetical protein
MSLRVQRIFEMIPEQLRNLGGYDVNVNECIKWAGQVTASGDGYQGYEACVIDLSSTTWATLNKRIIIVAQPAQDYTNNAAFRTQSHTAGAYIQGSVRFIVHAESPIEFFGASDAQKAYAQFLANVQTHLVGQMSAPVMLKFCNAGTQPTVESVNAAGSSSTFEATSWIKPYGLSYPGGI